jgi:hypothetical protein
LSRDGRFQNSIARVDLQKDSDGRFQNSKPESISKDSDGRYRNSIARVDLQKDSDRDSETPNQSRSPKTQTGDSETPNQSRSPKRLQPTSVNLGCPRTPPRGNASIPILDTRAFARQYRIYRVWYWSAPSWRKVATSRCFGQHFLTPFHIEASGLPASQCRLQI